MVLKEKFTFISVIQIWKPSHNPDFFVFMNEVSRFSIDENEHRICILQVKNDKTLIKKRSFWFISFTMVKYIAICSYKQLLIAI